MDMPEFLSVFTNVRRRGSNWEASCPVPEHGRGDGDPNPSLVFLERGAWYTPHCRAGCDREAIVEASGLLPGDFRREEGGAGTAPPSSSSTRIGDDLTTQECKHRDSIYAGLLSVLTLHPSHEASLKKRGFSEEAIVLADYSTVRPIDLNAFRKSVDCSKIPGLTSPQSATGILIPVRDPLGRILALKVRSFDESKPKYSYLSDRDCLSGSHLHFPVNFKLGGNPLRITEGEFKADYCQLHGHGSTVSLPGITSHALFSELAPQFGLPLEIILAWDWGDLVRSPEMCRLWAKFYEALKSSGVMVGLEHWDPKYKGVDDILAAGETTSVVWDNPLKFLAADPVTFVEVGNHLLPKFEHLPDPSPLEDFFPPRVTEFLHDTARVTGAPFEFSALAALTVAGTAVGTRRWVEVLPNWREYPLFWSCVVAPPGRSKSPVLRRAMGPVYSMQRESALDYAVGLLLHKNDKSKSTPLPEMVEYYTSDTTIEKLVSILENNPGGVILDTDEILSWVKALDRYSGGNDRQTYLKFFSVSDHYHSRKSGSSYVPRPFVSILGSTQPARLQELFNSEDGLVERVLFVCPKWGRHLSWSEKTYTSPPDRKWENLIRNLYGMDRVQNSVPLSTDALKAWEHGHDWHFSTLAEWTGPAQGHAFKWQSFALRLALLRAYLFWGSRRGPEPEISAEDVRSAWALRDVFLGHFKSAWEQSSPDIEWESVSALKSWVEAQHNGLITPGQIARSRHPLLPNQVGPARQLLIAAQDYGLGTLSGYGGNEIFEFKKGV